MLNDSPSTLNIDYLLVFSQRWIQFMVRNIMRVDHYDSWHMWWSYIFRNLKETPRDLLTKWAHWTFVVIMQLWEKNLCSLDSLFPGCLLFHLDFLRMPSFSPGFSQAAFFFIWIFPGCLHQPPRTPGQPGSPESKKGATCPFKQERTGWHHLCEGFLFPKRQFQMKAQLLSPVTEDIYSLAATSTSFSMVRSKAEC